MLNRVPHHEMIDTSSCCAKIHLQRIFFFHSHAWLKLSAANHSNNVVSALLAFRTNGFGMTILIIGVIAAVYTMQIKSQSNRLDFLPPDVPLGYYGAKH